MNHARLSSHFLPKRRDFMTAFAKLQHSRRRVINVMLSTEFVRRDRAFAHAARLPLHRVYGLKSGGATSLLREDAGGVGELIFSMLYNPWRALIQFAGGLVVHIISGIAALWRMDRWLTVGGRIR